MSPHALVEKCGERESGHGENNDNGVEGQQRQFVYRARFFGHKFDLSGVLHVDFLPGETRLARAA